MTGPRELHVGAVGAPICSPGIVADTAAEKMVSLKPSTRTKKDDFPTEGNGPRWTRERRKVSIGEKS